LTIVDLQEIDINAKCPPANMTDEEWQGRFRAMRLLIEPSEQETALQDRPHDTPSESIYYGDTIWQQYCKFVNSILTSIRNGETDYCFYIYQVADLLRFEHDRLETRWVPEYQCFEVWLAADKAVIAS